MHSALLLAALAVTSQTGDNSMVLPLDELFADIPPEQQRALAVVIRPPEDTSLQPAADDVQHALIPAAQSHRLIRSVVVLEDPDMVRGKQDMLLAQSAGENGIDVLLVVRVRAPDPPRAYPDVNMTVLDSRGVEQRNLTRNYGDLWRHPLPEPQLDDGTAFDDGERTPQVAGEDLAEGPRPGPPDPVIIGVTLAMGAATAIFGGLLATVGVVLFGLSYPVQTAMGVNPDSQGVANVMRGGGCCLMLPFPCFATGCLAFPLAGALAVVGRRDQGKNCLPLALGCGAASGAFCCASFGCASCLCRDRGTRGTPPPPQTDPYDDDDGNYDNDHNRGRRPERRSPSVRPRRPEKRKPSTRPREERNDDESGSRSPSVISH